MTQSPNYRQLTPPEDKAPDEYSWAERRAELYDMIERAGHYRNLERSQRELARRYGISKSTVHSDIHAVNEWIADHLGDEAEAELETLKNSAVKKLIDEGKTDKAFYLMMNFYETLMEAGVKDSAPDEVDLSQTVTLSNGATLEFGDEAGDADPDTDADADGE